MGLHIRVVTAPYFLTTKLEAFRGRGRGDYANSHDLEDLLTVMDGRETIVQELKGTPALRPYIAEQFRALLATPALLDALPGYLLPDVSSQARTHPSRQNPADGRWTPVKTPQTLSHSGFPNRRRAERLLRIESSAIGQCTQKRCSSINFLTNC